MQFTPVFGAEYVDRTDKNGRDHVAVKLVNQAESGQRQEFWTDLDRLEEVVRRAEAFWQGRETTGPANRAERIGDYAAAFYAWPPSGPAQRPGIHLEQLEKGQWQEFTTDIERLKSAIDFGRGVERELGYTQRWYTLVYADSIRDDDGGRVQARVFKGVESPEQAWKLLANNAGLALYPEPMRRPRENGEEIELPREASIQLSTGNMRNVGEHVERNEVRREAMGEHYLVARWNDVSRLPREGDRVTWEGSGETFNRASDDFRARPAGAGEQGEPEEPIYVLIRKGEGRLPGHGIIETFSTNRKEMVAELDRAEKLQQELTTDWHKQEFGMDRKHYGMDQAM